MNAFQTYLVMSGANALLRSTMFVVLSVYYVLTVHMNPFELILAGTALEGVYFLCQVPTGVFADTTSRRASIVIGWIWVGACCAFEGLVPSVVAILAAQGALGVGEAFIDGAEAAWIADEVGEERYAGTILRGSQIGQLGGLAGTLIGVALASIRLNLPIVTGGVLLIAIGLLLAVVMPEEGFSPVPRGEQTRRQAMGATIRSSMEVVRGRPVLVAILLIALFAGAASEGFDRLWQAHLIRDVHLPPLGQFKPVVWFGVISAGTGIAGIVTAQFFRRRLETVTRNHRATTRTLFLLDTLFIAGTVLFALAGTLPLALVGLAGRAVLGTMKGLIESVWLNQNIPNPQIRATVMSMEGSSNALGQFAGGPVLGIVGTAASLRAAIALTGLVLSPVLGLYAWVMRRGTDRPALTDNDIPMVSVMEG